MSTPTIHIGGAPVTLAELAPAMHGPVSVTIDAGCHDRLRAGRAVIEAGLDANEVIYGVTTGFGKLADVRIASADIVELQYRLVRSHQTGVGPPLPDEVVRMAMILKLVSLCQGNSAVRPAVVELLAAMVSSDVLPYVPAQGSVGASGDLAPLAHLTAALIGEGDCRWHGERRPATEVLAKIGQAPLELQAKEALALMNGTQISTATCLVGLLRAENILAAGVLSGSLSLEAANANLGPFDERIHRIRRQQGQIDVAAAISAITAESPILQAPAERRTQDPYSLRCQPQVMGAALDLLRFVADVLEREANAVTDNPLVFPAEGDILSGGNFHAEPVAFAADILTMALCEIGSISERRQFLLNDPTLSGLPAFLTSIPGLNSGFVLAQVTSAALVAENRGHAFPRSVDSVPTVANQEDHVSMAAHAARRVLDVAGNAAHIVAIELALAAQGVDLRGGEGPGPGTRPCYELVRSVLPTVTDDVPFSAAFGELARLVLDGTVAALLPEGAVTVSGVRRAQRSDPG